LLEIDMEELDINQVHNIDFGLPEHAGLSTPLVLGPSSGTN